MRAAEALLAVVDRGRSLEAALAAQEVAAAERARLREIATGGCRHYHRFDAHLARLLRQPLGGRARVVHCLLINACHQIAAMRTPDYAAVNAAVGAVAGTPHAWAGGLINAVLRNFLRQREELERELASAAGVGDDHHRHPRSVLSGGGGDGDGAGDGDSDGSRAGVGDGAGSRVGDGDGTGDAAAAAWFAHPLWLYREIRAHWPAHHRAILEAGNRKPPLTLRVNRARVRRDDYLAELAAAGLDAQPTADSDLGVTLASPLPVARIPGFAEGLASVQDESAQLVLAALAPAQQTAGVTVRLAGVRALDACAAPGGKTGLLLEAGATVTALDLPARVELLRENLARLGFGDGDRHRHSDSDGVGDGEIDFNERHRHSDSDGETGGDSHGDGANIITVIPGDLTAVAAWWDGASFDCILLDVPCTGSGVIRRHPDIKHRRRPSDVDKFAAQQLGLLRAAWHVLATGGVLLYVTCSILPAENDAVIAKFIDLQSEAAVQPIDASLGAQTRFGVQRLPGVHAGDGFYFCRMQKRARDVDTVVAADA